jgi:RNA polymerase sigma factor (sigma-70 family)
MTARDKAALLEAAVAAALTAAETCDPADRGEVAATAAALLEAQNALAVQFLPLARRVAGELRKRFPLVDLDELESECVAVVVRASRTWRPGRGASFQTWAYNAATRYGGPAAATKLNHRGFSGLSSRPTLVPGVTSDAVFSDGESRPVVELLTVEDPEGPALAADEWRSLFEGMPARLREVLRLRHAEGLTLRQAGAEMGYTAERVRQLERDAVAWLWRNKTRFMAEVVR